MGSSTAGVAFVGAGCCDFLVFVGRFVRSDLYGLGLVECSSFNAGMISGLVFVSRMRGGSGAGLFGS